MIYRLRQVCALLLCAIVFTAAVARAATVDFTVTTDEPVTVTGTPQIAVDVGGTTRYATYAAGSGTSTLTFSYQVQAGDFDANGVTLVSPLDLNGGSLTDAAGNPLSPLTFSLPDTSGIRVQTYTAAFITSPINNANATAVDFSIAKAPLGASFNYTITSDGGSGSVTGSGTISATPHAVVGVDVSGLPVGTLSLSITITTPAGGNGAARTATATPSFSGPAEGLPASAVALSIRRLRSGYSGPLLKVRRDDDNTELDIGATLAGNLDVTALGAFCGSASCFVRTWYDQSGNSRHAQMTTTSQQLSLVASGTLQTRNGLAALRATDQVAGLVINPFSVSSGSARTINAVFSADTLTSNAELVGATTGEMIDFGTNTASNRVRLRNNSSSLYSAGGTWPVDGAATVGSFTYDGSTTTAYRNSGSVVSATPGTLTWAAAQLQLMKSNCCTAPDVRGLIGTVQEFFYFAPSLSNANRQALEATQKSYFGTP